MRIGELKLTTEIQLGATAKANLEQLPITPNCKQRLQYRPMKPRRWRSLRLNKNESVYKVYVQREVLKIDKNNKIFVENQACIVIFQNTVDSQNVKHFWAIAEFLIWEKRTWKFLGYVLPYHTHSGLVIESVSKRHKSKVQQDTFKRRDKLENKLSQKRGAVRCKNGPSNITWERKQFCLRTACIFAPHVVYPSYK